MISRIYADATGTTHLSEYELPLQERAEDGEIVTRGLLNVPTTGLGIHDRSVPAPSADFHCTAPRKLIAVLRGTFQIAASDGERRRFGPGDCLLTDDLDSDGHAFEDVGDEPLLTVIVELAEDWSYPVG